MLKFYKGTAGTFIAINASEIYDLSSCYFEQQGEQPEWTTYINRLPWFVEISRYICINS